jgi:initiation factor 1A
MIKDYTYIYRMVKNQTGGNKSKQIARKDMGQTKTRFVQQEGELYGMVTKILGNNQCHVLCLDKKTRLCIIRKKFTGKHKQQHFLKSGSWVLIGMRDWETTRSDKMDKCDLLECYSESDKQIICQQSNVDMSMLEEKKTEEDDIVFSEAFEDI